MKIAITGGAGFIGSNLIKYLNNKGIKDIDIYEDLNNIYSKLNNISGLSFNSLLDHHSLIRNAYYYTHIIHLGAISSTSNKPDDFNLIKYLNIEFTNGLFNEVKDTHIKLIFASSASVYGNTSDFSERIDNVKPLHWYGMSKLLADRRIANENLGISLRFFNVYGPGEKHKIEGGMASPVTTFLYKLLNKNKISLFHDFDKVMGRDFIFVDDVCDIIYHSMTNKVQNGIYNVGSGEASGWYEIATLVSEQLGIKMADHFDLVLLPESMRPTYQYYTQADLTLLRSSFNFDYQKEFTPLKDGISRTFELDFA